MRRNPAVQIVRKLTEQQFQAVKKLFSKDKRAMSGKLLSLLRSGQKKMPAKEELFAQLYGEPHAPEKDYLLRNELRLLRQKLDRYLLTSSIEALIDDDDVFRQKMLLYAYKHNKLYDLFYDGYPKAEAIAIDSYQFDQALFIQNWYLDLAYQHQFSAVKNYEEKAAFFRQQGEKFRHTFDQYLAMQVRLQQFYHSMETYYQTLLGQPTSAMPLDDSNITFSINDHALSRYYYYRSKGFNVSGKERLDYFQKAYDSLKPHKAGDKYIIDLLVTVVLGIGRCLQQLGDFARADEYMSLVITEYAKEIPALASKDKLYSNYLTNLLSIGKYQKVLDLLQQLKKESSDNGYALYWYSIYELIAFIGLRRPQEIKESLPANYNEIPLQHRVYFRVISSIYYYLIGENEWAYKETYNLLHTKLADDYGKEQRSVMELLESFFQLNDKYLRRQDIPSREIQKLQLELSALDTSKINDINILPILIWLKKEVIIEGTI